MCACNNLLESVLCRDVYSFIGYGRERPLAGNSTIQLFIICIVVICPVVTRQTPCIVILGDWVWSNAIIKGVILGEGQRGGNLLAQLFGASQGCRYEFSDSQKKSL